MTDWYDEAFKEEREELVEIEDEILIPTELETDFVDDVCTCDFSTELCLVHNPEQENEEDSA